MHPQHGGDGAGHGARNTPLPEPVQAEDVGHAAAYLASPLAAGITGTTLYVDKGYHAMGMAAAESEMAVAV